MLIPYILCVTDQQQVCLSLWSETSFWLATSVSRHFHIYTLKLYDIILFWHSMFFTVAKWMKSYCKVVIYRHLCLNKVVQVPSIQDGGAMCWSCFEIVIHWVTLITLAISYPITFCDHWCQLAHSVKKSLFLFIITWLVHVFKSCGMSLLWSHPELSVQTYGS